MNQDMTYRQRWMVRLVVKILRKLGVVDSDMEEKAIIDMYRYWLRYDG